MFKPSKLRTESLGPSRPELSTPVQSRSFATSENPFREALISLFTEVIATANRLKTGAGADLPAGSGGVLQILEKEGARTVPQIARNRFTSRQNIQIVVNRLAREGLIELTDNPSHKRSALVKLTPKGEHLLAEVGKRRQEFLDSLAIQFSPQDLQSGASLLRRLRKALTERSSRSEKVSTGEGLQKKISPASGGKKIDVKEKNIPQDSPDTELPFNLL